MKFPWIKLSLPLPGSKVAVLAIALSAALLGSACTSQAAPTRPSQGPDDNDVVLLSSNLEVVDSCDALLDQIKEDALERVGPYGLDQPDIFFSEGGDIAVEDEESSSDPAADDIEPSETESGDAESAPAQPQANQSSERSGKATSGTNNQEDDVEESDLVKSDGKTLAIVAGSELRVLDVTGTTPILTKTISLAQRGQPTGMFLDGDQLILLSVDYGRQDNPTSILTEIDVKTGIVGGSAEFEGQYVSSREVDGTLRLVISSTTSGIGFVYPDRRTNESEAEEENRAIIEQSKIEDWLPEYRITGNGTRQSSEQLVDCANVHLPQNFSGGGQVAVVTVETDRPLDIVDALSVHTDAQTVYASADRLVIAAPQWPRLGDRSDRQSFASPYSTAVHSFDTSSSGATAYVASGSVRGLLLNQFSLSEHDGYLRVATTDQSPNGGWDGRVFTEPVEAVSESFVSVLSEQDGALDVVGQVGGLGKGETIFAVRFIGNVGYVVTFRQTDPLYTVDLSDPSNPSVLGELKIPGFSNYLHEVDDRTLLGVGSDGTDSGQVLGASVSLFDVEDLSDPTRLDKLSFQQHTWTPVAEDAKAFTFWRETNTAIVPVLSHGGAAIEATDSTRPVDEETYSDRMVSQAAVIDVDPEVGRMELRGTIDHQGRCGELETRRPNRRIPRDEETDDRRTPDPEAIPVEPDVEYDPYLCDDITTISRTMIIGDDIFTFSSAGIAVHNLDSLAEVAWVSFL